MKLAKFMFILTALVLIISSIGPSSAKSKSTHEINKEITDVTSLEKAEETSFDNLEDVKITKKTEKLASEIELDNFYYLMNSI
ncbi:hypothetical protein QUF86_01535 [Peribacillus sp. NJ11]|uniref:hypothetical protein n=1 Tax=Peribacillus sp. NJ11 TaxID=3055861 RepID=UPI0025A107D8|nr:hypothetical protein [Peribacillus sp. NJ11]MDM5219515.1 hypothetical protein [Peribacillus sp. NJ11]